MTRFDGTGPRGQGVGGFGRGNNWQSQGRGRRAGQRQCLLGEGTSAMGNRVGATPDLEFSGFSIERLKSTIEAMQVRLAELKLQDKS